MTPEEARALKAGDLIKHQMIEAAWLVTYTNTDLATGCTRITAVRTIDITNLDGWETVRTRRKK